MSENAFYSPVGNVLSADREAASQVRRLAVLPDQSCPSRARHFLIISAPFGPFTRELAARLTRSGAVCSRIILNAGDLIDWGGLRGATVYFGARAGWSDWLKRLVIRRGVTDIVTYGDSSPYTAAAVRLAEILNLRTHVFEQGYFRPDWVTLEHGGVNANSRLPRDPAWYRTHPDREHLPAAEKVGRTTPSAIARIVAYHAAMYAGALVFPRYRAPYQHSALLQTLSHCWRFAAQRLSVAEHERRHNALTAAKRPLYLVLLQRPGDSQLWRHSDFERVEAFLDRVVASFARHAPVDAQLLVRPHPFDHGLDPHEPVIRRLSRRYGVEGRIHYVDHGKLHEILPLMRGAVCVNSTAGLAAVEFGCPTVVLGRAVYDMAGLTHQGGMDTFWRSGEAPDPNLYLAFRSVLMATTQINGAYATRRGRDLAAPEAANRMLAYGCEQSLARARAA
jgi:capsular polysaccharide export protein